MLSGHPLQGCPGRPFVHRSLPTTYPKADALPSLLRRPAPSPAPFLPSPATPSVASGCSWPLLLRPPCAALVDGTPVDDSLSKDVALVARPRPPITAASTPHRPPPGLLPSTADDPQRTSGSVPGFRWSGSVVPQAQAQEARGAGREGDAGVAWPAPQPRAGDVARPPAPHQPAGPLSTSAPVREEGRPSGGGGRDGSGRGGSRSDRAATDNRRDSAAAGARQGPRLEPSPSYAASAGTRPGSRVGGGGGAEPGSPRSARGTSGSAFPGGPPGASSQRHQHHQEHQHQHYAPGQFQRPRTTRDAAGPGAVPSNAAAASAAAAPVRTTTTTTTKIKRRMSPPVFADEDEQVAAAYDNLPLEVTGRSPPAPVLSFNDMGSRTWQIPPLLLHNAVGAYKLRRPTPVQSHVMPAVMEGRDVLAVSCTGSGKTLAYLLPLLAQLMTRNRMGPKNVAYPDALVLVPTRELAEQVYADIQVLIRYAHLKALVVHGGVSLAEQVLAVRGKRKRSAGGVDVLVATPGRLLELVDKRQAVRLGKLGLVVVDEADVMLDLGMWPDLRRLLCHPTLPTARQTVLVSAVLPGTDMLRVLRDEVSVVVGDSSGATGIVRQHVELVWERDKLTRLAELLAPGAGGGVAGIGGAATSSMDGEEGSGGNAGGGGQHGGGGGGGAGGGGGPTVVFAHSLSRADEVARTLAARGLSVALLHRDLSQDQRDEALQCFRFGVASVLVTTSLAARGLNFPDVAHVINYDVPVTESQYVHQVGRTGRGGRPGRATTLFAPSRRQAAPWMAALLRRTGNVVPPWLEAMAMAVQAEGDEAEQERVRVEQEAAAAVKAAAAAAENKNKTNKRQEKQKQKRSMMVEEQAAGQDGNESQAEATPQGKEGKDRGGVRASGAREGRPPPATAAAAAKDSDSHTAAVERTGAVAVTQPEGKRWGAGFSKTARPVRHQRKRVVDLGDPTDLASRRFGSYLPPKRAAAATTAAAVPDAIDPLILPSASPAASPSAPARPSAAAQARPQQQQPGASGDLPLAPPPRVSPPGRPAQRTVTGAAAVGMLAAAAGGVVDCDHDPDHWQAVFLAALKPVATGQQQQRRTEATLATEGQQQRGRQRPQGPSYSQGSSYERQQEGAAVVAEELTAGGGGAAAVGAVPRVGRRAGEGREGEGEGGQRPSSSSSSSSRLLFEDVAVRLEAEPSGGITAGAGWGAARR